MELGRGKAVFVGWAPYTVLPPLLVDAGIFCTNNMLFLLDIHAYEIYAVERKKKLEVNTTFP
jgi:hypothetical protein